MGQVRAYELSLFSWGKKKSRKGFWGGGGGGGVKNQFKKTTNQKVLHWNIMYRKKQQA